MESDNIVDFPPQDTDPRDVQIMQLRAENSALQQKVEALNQSLEFLGNTMRVMHKLTDK